MARIVRDSKLETREARKALKVKKEPYWRSIHQGAHIGYYKGEKSSSWVARYRSEGCKRGYRKKTLGKVDDFQDADGVTMLSYKQATELAHKWFREIGLVDAGHLPSGKYTVQDAIDDYGFWYKSHRKSWSRVSNQINAHIIPVFGTKEVSKITTRQIQDWHQKLAETPPRRRTSRFSKKQNIGAIDSDEALRRRKSTANRILTILKAALNKAYNEGKVESDDAWRRVKPFRGVDVAKIRYLSQNEIKRLINSTEKDFRPMVEAAIYTGCRYSELARLKKLDFNQDSQTLYIHESKNGKPRNVVLTEEAQDFFQNQILGKKGDNDLIFTRYDGEAWGRAHQTRRLQKACKNARIEPAISFHILRHTHASQLAMNGVPMAVIAYQLGHSDTRTAEKHYAHLSPSYVADTIRQNFPKLGISKNNNVKKISN